MAPKRRPVAEPELYTCEAALQHQQQCAVLRLMEPARGPGLGRDSPRDFRGLNHLSLQILGKLRGGGCMLTPGLHPVRFGTRGLAGEWGQATGISSRREMNAGKPKRPEITEIQADWGRSTKL